MRLMGYFAIKNWLHCEVGGHPHLRARMLLNTYETALAPVASLLPDAVHYLRRLWTSLRLLLPKLTYAELGKNSRSHWLTLSSIGLKLKTN